MGKQRRHGRTDQRYEQRRLGRALEFLLGKTRLGSARNLARRVGRDPSTVAGWIRGRTLPGDDSDYEALARHLDASADGLRSLANLDESILEVSKLPLAESDRAGMIAELERQHEKRVQEAVDLRLLDGGAPPSRATLDLLEAVGRDAEKVQNLRDENGA